MWGEPALSYRWWDAKMVQPLEKTVWWFLKTQNYV